MKVFECEATIENFDKVTAFVEEELENNEVDMKSSTQITIALEEIYVNIAHYAYSKTDADGNVIPNTGTGPMKLSIDVSSEQVLMTFEDKGIPYNPLEKADPDITLSAEERDIGGLGIYMVKQSMDDVVYEHRDGKNILTLVKKL